MGYGRLKDRVALITGAARGQGRAIAEKFAREGAHLVLVDHCEDVKGIRAEQARVEDLEQTRAMCAELGVSVLDRRCDVRDQQGLDGIVGEAVERLGAVDILVAQAGVVQYNDCWDITEDEWEAQVSVCLTGAYRSLKAVSLHMMDRQRGAVVFSSSVAAAETLPKLVAYSAAKHGVIGVMQGAALELAPYGIRVNAVLPGAIDTAMNDNPESREIIAGKPGASREDYLEATRSWFAMRGRVSLPASAVADAVAWLVSDEAAHVTGIQVPVEAGHLLLPRYNHNPVRDGSHP
ncbi:SDR family NAD(P)-dependent oxidoreductase [Nocardioides cavernae]|nr:SDR family NAD(P)-dependent oxidoreductase [Nocardioides cavernae]